MSKFYRGKRTRNIFDPNSSEPFKLSRTRLDLFIACPRCFYVDRRLGVDRPPGFPFALNSAVDALLKKEFDLHRADQTPHPLMKTNGVDAIPFKHDKMNEWRDAPHGGITHLHEPTNFLLSGVIDDVWLNSSGEIHIVDYKATAKTDEVSLDADWQDGYKRQAEIYQWLFRQNGFKVSKIAYFLYCNGDLAAERFDQTLRFSVKIIPYEGNDGWVEKAVMDARECLLSTVLPNANPDCDFCLYFKDATNVLKSNGK